MEKFVWKIGWRDKVEKLCRTFGGQIGWTNLMDKLVEKLCEKLCGKIVRNWVETLIKLWWKNGWKALLNNCVQKVCGKIVCTVVWKSWTAAGLIADSVYPEYFVAWLIPVVGFDCWQCTMYSKVVILSLLKGAPVFLSLGSGTICQAPVLHHPSRSLKWAVVGDLEMEWNLVVRDPEMEWNLVVGNPMSNWWTGPLNIQIQIILFDIFLKLLVTFLYLQIKGRESKMHV